MASMRKKGKSGYYYARFYDPNRRPKQKTVALKTTRKDVARRRLASLEERYEKGTFDPWTDNTGGQQRLSVEEALDAFLDVKRKQIRQTTLDNYRSNLEAWHRDHCPAGLLLQDLSAEQLRPYDSGKAQNTRCLRYRILRTFLNWTVEEGHLERSSLENVHQPKKEKKQPAFLSAQDVEKLLLAIEAYVELRKGEPGRPPDDQWLADMIKVGVATGLRRGEMLRLRWRDVDLVHGILHVRNHKDGERTKSGHERSVKLVGSALETLRHLHAERGEEGGRVFLDSRGKPIKASRASKRFKFFVRQAKLPSRERLSLHSMRHTTGSWLAMQGVPMRVIQAILGHQQASTTEIYMHATSTAAARAMEETFGNN